MQVFLKELIWNPRHDSNINSIKMINQIWKEIIRIKNRIRRSQALGIKKSSLFKVNVTSHRAVVVVFTYIILTYF